jgi:hypothetical protein
VSTSAQNGRRLWWLPEVKESLAFLAGLGILFHQTAIAPAAQTILVVAAVAMMGVLGSGVAQRALRKVLENGDAKK